MKDWQRYVGTALGVFIVVGLAAATVLGVIALVRALWQAAFGG